VYFNVNLKRLTKLINSAFVGKFQKARCKDKNYKNLVYAVIIFFGQRVRGKCDSFTYEELFYVFVYSFYCFTKNIAVVTCKIFKCN